MKMINDGFEKVKLADSDCLQRGSTPFSRTDLKKPPFDAEGCSDYRGGPRFSQVYCWRQMFVSVREFG
jgi:hypothetical protein